MVDARVDDVEPEWLEEEGADAVEEDEDGHEEHEHLEREAVIWEGLAFSLPRVASVRSKVWQVTTKGPQMCSNRSQPHPR